MEESSKVHSSLFERLVSTEFRENPYALYKELRENDPVHLAATTPIRQWFVTRYEDVVFVLKDPRFGREYARVAPPGYEMQVPEEWKPIVNLQKQWMLLRDPPNHTRLRSLVNTAFTPKVVARLRPHIEDIANDLILRLQEKSSIDVISDYAFPLPVIVIAEMLGVPTEDRDQFREWSSIIAKSLDLSIDPTTWGTASQVAIELTDYFRGLVHERKKNPRQDMISDLIAAEEQGDKLNEDELLATCILLLVAGHETTVNLIGNAVLLLTLHPEAQRQLRAQPGLIETAVEEFLRFESPVQMTARIAFEDVELNGRLIRKGDQVTTVLGSANRDPEVFSNPDVLDLSRTPNRHLSFATGIHYCVGAPLARLEAAIAIQALLRAFGDIQRIGDTVEWRESTIFRGPVRLPIRV
jgi:pimeloyl-[acyl-carrier protein] synthase